MTVSESKGRLMLRLSETLLIGAIGGALLGLSGFPAGWLSGAIIAVTAAALIGRPVVIPPVMGQGVLVVVGISLGAAVTPATLARVSSWPGSLFILAVAMTCATAAMMFYLHRFQKWDLLSALFATSPGAMAQLLAMAAEVGADFRAIAMVQSVRVLALTVALPLVLAAFGATGTPVPRAAVSLLDGSAGELIVLVLVSGAGAVLAHRLRVPGGLTSGAMTISGVLHVTGLIKVTFPPSVAIASFVVLGSMIGARFVGTDLRLLRHLAAIGLTVLAIGTTVIGLFAVAAAAFLPIDFGDILVAYAPGGLEAMAALAFALHLDAAFVGVHHLARFVFVSLLIPIIVARTKPHVTHFTTKAASKRDK